ncbi:tRNA pseudouridine synthase-like 1 isoform X1 [Leptopilina boulardi]|uniref:tRNA pseudouridine synthase-like 1 isoform X1 n=1 Tax=Leptopilina boulardi TaxID=63433 RepID=UPI0021F5FDF9|nr:tRNA pseudouridine synthase-like 1 isoform X1 [Leptopilina boulardi]
MNRYLLFFSYLGHRYRGLQRQSGNSNILDVDCIQGAIEAAFTAVKPKIINHKFVSSSRTDAGVHGLFNAAHVELENKLGLFYHPESLTRFLNRHLLRCRHEIRILKCIPITKQFHARHSALSRTYYFRFAVAKNSEIRNLSPISEMNRSTTIRLDEFDIEKLRNGMKHFVGLRDFGTFSVEDKIIKTKVYRRILYEMTLEKAMPLVPFDPNVKDFDYWHLIIRGKSFVHNQIRRMVGALFGLASGRITEKELITMLQVPSKNSWNSRIATVPANGLYLVNVEYNPEELKENTIIYNEKEFLRSVDFDY